MITLTDLVSAIGAASPRPPQDGTRAHRITVSIGGQQIDGWSDYEIASSMVEPSDGFRLTGAFDKQAWKLCKLDSSIKVAIDGTTILDGFIDDRAKRSADGTMEIAGRDKAGRLVQESIPTVAGFDGLLMVDAIKKLAAPWFTNVTLSDARNRSIRRGKGHRAPASGEPAVFTVKGKLDEEHAGRVDPGETRWNVIEQLVSSVGVLCWSSADGRELVVGKPNYSQAIQYLFRHSRELGSTVKDLQYEESIGDGFALVEVHGAGAGDESNYGDDVCDFIGTAKDGPNPDGTGRDFQFPKRLAVRHHALQDNAEAARDAAREMTRRNFKRRHMTVSVALHGQVVAGTLMTLFAPNTLARCIDDDLDLDETWLIYACSYKGNRGGGETTEIMLVPRGTEFVA